MPFVCAVIGQLHLTAVLFPRFFVSKTVVLHSLKHLTETLFISYIVIEIVMVVINN